MTPLADQPPRATRTPSPLTVRKIPFEFSDDLAPHWNPAKPEWSQMVNGASLAMPYLEPYLIRAVRAGLASIDDPALLAEARDYCAQEGQHYRQHKRFNELLVKAGYKELPEQEARMQRTFDRFFERRSLRFHLAYAAGFETMALSVGHWLVNDREYLFADSDSRVASLVLWHFVEEIEHKNSAFDVYQHVYGNYPTRIFGLFYASFHVMALARRAYRAMLIRDGLWWKPSSRIQLWKEVGRFLGQVLPHMLTCCTPNHNPRDIADPAWVDRWKEKYSQLNGRLPLLDTKAMTADPSFQR